MEGNQSAEISKSIRGVKLNNRCSQRGVELQMFKA